MARYGQTCYAVRCLNFWNQKYISERKLPERVLGCALCRYTSHHPLSAHSIRKPQDILAWHRRRLVSRSQPERMSPVMEEQDRDRREIALWSSLQTRSEE